MDGGLHLGILSIVERVGEPLMQKEQTNKNRRGYMFSSLSSTVSEEKYRTGLCAEKEVGQQK